MRREGGALSVLSLDPSKPKGHLMPWFKVDDGTSSKSEFMRIPRASRLQVVGLWTFAGAWSAKELSDGHIPAYMLDEFAAAAGDAQALVDVGLWRAVDDGWQFVLWAPDQPLREAVLENRRKNTERVQGWRAKNVPRNDVTNEVGASVANDDVTVPPSHPVPAHPIPPKRRARAKPARDYSDEFLEFWGVYPRKQAKPDAWSAYKEARERADARKIFAGAQAYALLNVGKDKNFIKLPGGWLRFDQWDDEQIEQTPETSPGKSTPAKKQFKAHPDARRDPDSWMQQPADPWMPSSMREPKFCAESGHDEYPMPCDLCARLTTTPEGANF